MRRATDGSRDCPGATVSRGGHGIVGFRAAGKQWSLAHPFRRRKVM